MMTVKTLIKTDGILGLVLGILMVVAPFVFSLIFTTAHVTEIASEELMDSDIQQMLVSSPAYLMMLIIIGIFAITLMIMGIVTLVQRKKEPKIRVSVGVLLITAVIGTLIPLIGGILGIVGGSLALSNIKRLASDKD